LFWSSLSSPLAKLILSTGMIFTKFLTNTIRDAGSYLKEDREMSIQYLLRRGKKRLA
jgi:hypothetical protein